MRTNGLLNALLFGIALISSATILGTYIYKSRQSAQLVTVKGLAERTVVANVGIWPISFRIADDNLQALQEKLTKQKKMVASFLQQQGFGAEEITYGIPDIEDKEAKSYSIERKLRYVAQATIILRSSKVALLEATLQKSDALISQGIVLENSWDYKPKFLFTNLNEIKPAMIQEATLSARKSAEQFARDSNSHVGKIQQATQGLFSIDDTHIPTEKGVRLVTTVQYMLVDK
jgi:hypothetical protein